MIAPTFRSVLGRVARWAAGVGLLSLTIVCALNFGLPRLVNTESVRGRLLSEVSSRVRGKLEASALELAFLPAPRVVLREARLEVPGRAAVRARSVTLHPQFLPLLRGRIRLSSVDLDQPRATIRIPEVPFPGKNLPTLAEAETKLAEILAGAERFAPGVSCRVRAGALDLSDGKTAHFRFTGVEGRVDLPPSRLRIRGQCTSDIAERVELLLQLDPAAWRGDGRLTVRRLRPSRLIRYLSPSGGGPLEAEETSVTVTAISAGRGRLQTGVGAAMPSALLRLNRDSLPLREAEVRGTVAAFDGGVKASLSKLSVRAPHVALSGSFSWAPRESKARADLKGTGLDATLLRRAALALGADIEGVRIACDVVRGGAVDQVSATAAANAPSGLLSENALSIRGTARSVALHLPWVGLEVTDGAGEVEYQKGIFSGRHLSGRTEGGVAHESSLRMGFFGRRLPFHLDLAVSADLERVTPLLRRLVPSSDVQRELALIRDVQGTGSGRVVVGEWLDDLDVRVDAREAKLSCRYGRFPHLLSLRADHFGYAGAAVNVSGLQGTAGASSFAGVSGTAEWAHTPTLRVVASSGRAFLPELHRWLTTFTPIHEAFKDFGSPSGIVAVSELGIRGPFFEPGEWHLSLKGDVEDFGVQSSLFPGTLQVSKGRLELSDHSVQLSAATARLLDSSVVGSGAISGFGTDHRSWEAAFDGRVGQQTADWIARSFHAPAWLKVNRSVEVRGAHFTRDPAGEVGYRGDHLLEAGPQVEVSLRERADGLSLDRLSIRDAATQATASASRHGRSVHFTFRGILRRETVDRLLDKNPFLRGYLEGDFALAFDPKDPQGSSGVGWLRVGGVEIPMEGASPLLIESASLRGEGKQVEVENGRLSLGGQRAVLNGSLVLGEDWIRPALTLSAEELDGEKLRSAFGAGTGDDARWLERLRELPIRGTLALDFGRLRFGRFLFSPLRADVRLDGASAAVTASRVGLCGIDLSGSLDSTPGGASLELRPAAKGADLATTLDCLGHAKDLASGTFRLTADASARAPDASPGSLLKGSRGQFSFKAEDGRIQRFGLLSKILGVLNLTEIFRGRLPDLVKSGLGYRSIRSSGRVDGGKLIFEESTVDAASMNLFWDGSIDLTTGRADITVIVSPLKTFDAIVSRIPVVNYVLGRTLISVPVRVTGDLSDPTIIPLSPSAVGQGILGLMKRTLLLPYKLIQPLLPSGEKSTESKP